MSEKGSSNDVPPIASIRPEGYDDTDVFGSEDAHNIKYKTLSWELVAVLMIAEIVSNGMLSLPSTLALVGIIPGMILIVFLGVFATYTSWLLIRFKLRHPQVHTMGDAGYILFGPLGREILAFGTVVFAIFATGSQMLAGELALAELSDHKLCTTVYTAIFAAPTLLLSFPRTFDSLGWISVPSVICISAAGIMAMVAAALYPTPDRHIDLTLASNFNTAFTSVTNIIFSYAGHFMFFVLISEMKQPQKAMRAAWTLQGFATTFYAVFAAITYIYLGSAVTSPSFSSLPDKWAKAAYGVAIPNFLIAGSLYSHTASKLVFVRIFRKSKHLHSHTATGWLTWTVLIVFMNGAAFVLAVGVPIFNYLIGLAASLFAAWFTYGIAGMFFLYDTYKDDGGVKGWSRHSFNAVMSVATILAGLFFCVAGTYVSIKAIVDGYRSGSFPAAFAC